MVVGDGWGLLLGMVEFVGSTSRITKHETSFGTFALHRPRLSNESKIISRSRSKQNVVATKDGRAKGRKMGLNEERERKEEESCG